MTLKCLKSTLVAGLLGGFALTLAAAPDLDTTLKGIEDRYNKAGTMEVGFTEHYQHTTHKGTLYLKKPNRMLWKYTSPAGRLFLADGKFVYDYTPGDIQVERQPFKTTEDMRAPLAFLLGKLNFHRDFDSKFLIASDGTITAQAKSDDFPYTQVSFLAEPDFSIHKLSVTLQDNSVIEYTFDDEKRNPPIPDSLFRFTPPSGVKVVDPLR
jgi:outer membrane lipoprotein carrier protein